MQIALNLLSTNMAAEQTYATLQKAFFSFQPLFYFVHLLAPADNIITCSLLNVNHNDKGLISSSVLVGDLELKEQRRIYF